MKALVIGSTGIIGNHIVRELLNDGHEVFAASRGITPSRNLEGLQVKSVQLDILDLDSLKKAFKGMDCVFQAAAYYPDNTFNSKLHCERAMQGLENVIHAALASHIERLVYTSSLTTIGQAKKGELANEDLKYDLFGQDPHPYFLVKHLSEQRLNRAFLEKGLPVVMLNPSGCFGPYELKPKTMCLVPQLISREIPSYILRDINVVDTRDVARGHVLAATKGRLGERYILGGHNQNTEIVIREICEVGGVKPPRFTVPLQIGVGLCMMAEGVGYVLKRKPRFPVLGLRFIQYGQHLDISKARTEFGYEPQPMAPCYKRAIQWYKDIGYC